MNNTASSNYKRKLETKSNSEDSIKKMKSKDNLIELAVADWVALRDMYLKDWPEHNTEYNALNNAIRLVGMDAERYRSEFQVLTLNGEWSSDATFILIVSAFLFLQSNL